MNSREEIAFLGRAAREMRGIADQFPAGAGELRQMASELEAEAQRKSGVLRDAIHPEDEVLSGAALGQAYPR